MLQVYESDSLSPNIKPPPTDDGTPNESVSDVFVRVTQVMSVLETQYSEDTVIIVSPDSDNLTILQAGLTGLDLRRQVAATRSVACSLGHSDIRRMAFAFLLTCSSYHICRHRDLSFGPGEVRYVDASSIPTYKQPESKVYKCLNPPSCT